MMNVGGADSRSARTAASNICSLFLRDCSDLSTLCKLDEFRKNCFIPATVFEEIELYTLFDIYLARIGAHPQKLTLPAATDATTPPQNQDSSTNNALAIADDSPSSASTQIVDTPLRKAIRRLYLHALYEDDKGSPLVSFQLIVHKRLQILDKFQIDVHNQLRTFTDLKAKFEQLPLASPLTTHSSAVASPHDDSSTTLQKQLQKAMSKSDTKKGLFSQFKKSRHETIYKILSKYASHPLSMVSVDTDSVRDYLIDFCCNTNQQRKKRLKAYSSLIFVALGHGSLEDILKILHATLSLSPDPSILCDYETEEHGIVLRPEVLKALQRFHQYVQTKENEIKDSRGDNADTMLPAGSPAGKAPFQHHFALPTSCKKPLSVMHMFSLFIHYLDVLNRSHDSTNLLLQMRDKSLKCIWQEYTIELKPATFDNLKSLIDKLVQMRSHDSVRTAAVLVCFRVLKLNVQVLSLWHNGSSSALSRRMKYQKGDFVHDLKEYILTFLREQQDLYSKHVAAPTTHYYKEHIDKKSPHHSVQQQGTPRGAFTDSSSMDLEEHDDLVIVTPKAKSSRVISLENIGEYVPLIFESITEVLCHGFTLFFSDSGAQIAFLQDTLEQVAVDPVKKLVARYLLHKLANDVLFFESVILSGLRAKQESQIAVDFMQFIITFIREHTLHKIKTGADLDVQMEHILYDCTNLLLLWQTHVLHHVSDTPVKQRRSTIPKLSVLNDTDGKSLFEYIGLVLQCCSRLCVEACSFIDDTSRTHIEKTLKDGMVGRLVFPLLQNIIKLLWRNHNSQQERQSIDLLLKFVYPHITDLLRTANSLNIMFDIREPIFEWKIVETCHPYQTNSAEDIKITFPALHSLHQKNGIADVVERHVSQPVAVTVKFDPRCRTACQADNLRITSSYVPQNADISPSLQFSGHGSSIPVNPLLSWGDTMSVSFRSDDKQTDWGMKLAVFPLYHFHWLYEFEKYLGWIGGRFSTFILSEHPYMAKIEQPFESWLETRPFFYGALSDGTDADKPTENSQIAETLTFLNGIINLDNSKSVALVDFMNTHLRAESMMLHDQEFVIKTERAIISAILYHSNLVGLATEFTLQMVNQLHQEVPKPLIQVWRQARNIRMWMVQTKQLHQTTYDTLCAAISQKVKFLLSLSPSIDENLTTPVVRHQSSGISTTSAVHLQETSHNANSPVSSAPSQKFAQMKGAQQLSAENIQTQSTRTNRASKSAMKNPDTVADQINKLRKMKHRTEENEIHNVDQISKVILNFVKTNVAVNDLARVMTMRTSRAMSRAHALRSLAELFECTQFYTVKSEVLKDVKYILRSRSFNNDIDFHYLNNTEGCRFEAHKELTSTFEVLIRMLISELDNWPSEELVLSGMLREIMEICFFSFKPCDVEWVLRFRFLEKICPLMYDSPAAQIDKSSKLQATQSLLEEKREIRKRAWKIFRMLSVRCVEMLEQWDEKEQFQIPATKREEVRAQIDELRDKIFGLLFDELEEMIRNNNIFSDVLEEMLSLMVSLCNTASAQICLSSKRFQRLLLPLLRVGIPKVQELSLQLCSQLILNSSASLQDENPAVEDQNSLKLLHVLFDFLGSYQIGQILGKDFSSTQRTLIPLHMAKEIFILLRKLFHESAPAQWRSDIRLLMETNIHDIPTLTSLLEDRVRLPAASESIKRILATLTILNGFAYVPSEGENIFVRLNGKWEAAKVCSMEENRHSITYLLTDKRYLNKTQRTESERVKTLTDHCLDPKVFELSDSHIQDICSFISVAGQKLYLNQEGEKDESVPQSFDITSDSQAQTLLTASWMSFLRYVYRLLEDPAQTCKPQLIRVLIDNFDFLKKLSKLETNQKYGHEHKLDCCSFAFTGKQFTRQYYYSCITCGMSNTKAVCAYCARTCHRGHRLGKPELGEFYCDCGAGEGKNKCRSLKKSAPESELTVERMESLLLRLHSVIPLYQEISKSQQNSSFFIGRTQPNAGVTDSNINLIIGPTRFVIQPMQSRTGYTVNASTHEISFSQANSSGFTMLGTDFCIPKSWHGFYFEVEIVDCGPTSGICIGISEKLQCNKPWPQVLKSSYSLYLSVSSATLYKGINVHKSKYNGLKLHQGDIIGCGYSKDKGHIFFTRNGKNLGHAFEQVPDSVGPYFPTLVMRGDNARLRTNLGQTSFLFNVSEAYSTINAAQKHDISAHFTSTEQSTAKSSTDTFQNQIKELRSIGFYDKKRIKDAISVCDNNDANAVVSYIHRSSVKPLHQALVEKMRQMGFEQHMCFRALKLTGNDIQRAIDLLIEGQIDDSNPSEDEIREYETDLGHFGFLGTETFQSDFDQELSRGMLQNPDVKVNTAAYTDVDIYKVSVYDLLVINPHINPPGKPGTNNSLYPLRSRIGVVIRKLLNGAYVQTFDPQQSTYMTSFVAPDDLRTCPPEFSALTLSTVGSTCLDFYRNISVIYCREIVTLLMQQVQRFDFHQYPSDTLYELFKVVFAPQYNQQHHNLVASTVKLPKKYTKMLKNMQNVSDESGLSLVDYVAQNAKAELMRYAKTLPQTRKVIFRNEINARPQHLRIFGASSIYLKFADNCQLQTEQDVLIFTYDRNGRKIARLFKGPLVLPKHAVIHGSDELWFHFKVSSLQEGSGFEFYATGGTHRLPEQMAFTQPNMALACSLLEHVSAPFMENNTARTNQLFTDLISYLTVPFAPFKVSICHALHNILDVVKQLPIVRRPNLEILNRFRLELEQLRKRFDTFSTTAPNPLPVFHALVEWFSALRLELVSDLCCNVRGVTHEKHHIYQYKEPTSQLQLDNVRKVRGCASCMAVQVLTVASIDNTKYYGHGRARCELNASNSLQWYDKKDNENLFPIQHMNVNPGDWFEHLTWIDQLAIVRQLSEYFVNPGVKPCPEWALYEAALETKKKVQYRESEHPYKIINDEGMIRIPGAKTLFISFDKHSQTHRCDKLCFSAKYAGADDLGAFSGEELKDKTLIVHGNTVHYKFKSDGGDHECTCNHCGKRIIGVRYHCTVCDDFDLCSRCIRKIRVHHETHIFLKIRRPVDCVPASLPLLYTSRWANSAHYRSNHHYGVKCNACGKSPIVGVRYWCENCEDYNLCEKCAEDEYLHHDRMHVFLRVLRPLPPKSQMPLNALPYGLVYEKELDTHWGYLFSVSSTDANYKYSDPKILQLTEQIDEEMQCFSPIKDADLVRYIESHCKQGWQSLEWNSLRLNDKHLIHHPYINEVSTKAIRYRFIALKLLNRKISRIMHLLSFDEMDRYSPNQSLSELVSQVRNRIFHSVKMDAWNHSVHNSLIEINPISMHLNRHLAAEEGTKLSEHSAYNSLFNQAFKQAQAINPRVLSRKGGAWKITFVNESADDYGGPFRESLNQICMELQSLDQLDLLIPIPNREEGQGENREKFMPNPRALTRRYEKWYTFFGILIGVGLLSKNVLPLDLPSIFWKHIVHEPITTDDLNAIDQMQYQSLQALKHCDGVTPDTFSDIFFHNFVIAASDGTEIELIPNGRDIPVTYDNRLEYVQLAEEYKLHEIDFQMKHVLQGLYSIIPRRFFPIFTWSELERLICGDPQIDLKVLKKHTIYEGYTAQSKQIKDFWSVMQKFTEKERSMYLRFVWGRSRLPVSEEGYTHPMKIQKLERANPDRTLPLSHTCFFSLELPAYSSKSVLQERLLFAITHCIAIDTDQHATRILV